MGLFSLAGRKAVITGAASGIGEAAAARFAGAGAEVILADKTDASSFAAELGGRYVRTDVSDESSVERLLLESAADGPIHVLINSAGITSEAALPDIKITDFRRMIETNTCGVLFATKHAPAYMPDGGAIVNVASLAASVGFPTYASYAASKAAVVALTQVAAVEYGPRGIRVNCVCPSSVDTPMLRSQPSGQIEAAVARAAAPLGRISEAAHVAALLHFLAADDCPLISGQAIAIDGGATAGFSLAVLESIVAAAGQIPP
jgi:NAD(P)-dependent dehydrogenase (short-subunit alcohol dehydrogenase family)